MSDNVKRTDLLTQDQVKAVAEGVRRILGDELLDKAGQYGIDLHDSIAFGPVAAQVQQAREAEGLSLKHLARELHVAQYRIRDVEGSRIKQIQPDVLRRVIERLGLGGWYATWAEQNAELARRLT